MAEKRPANSEPSEETLTICTNCSNISNNLKTCEHCGSALAEKSGSRSEGAEPLTKRARTSTDQRTASNSAENNKDGAEGSVSAHPPSTAAGAVSSTCDNSVAKGTAASGSRSNTPGGLRSATASPALSRSRNSSPVDKNANSTKSTVNSSTTGSATGTQSIASAKTVVATTAASSTGSSSEMNGNPVPQMLYMNNSTRGPTPSSAPTPTSAPVPTGPPMPTGAIPMNMYVNVNNQAVPIPTQATAATDTNTVSSRTRSGTTTSPAPARTNASAPSQYSNTSGADQTASNVNKFSLVIDVHQIRVGVRKFLPMPNSSVLFKDDGVLFTLKGSFQDGTEYPNAPLLLNARAIQQCKANLTSQMPALFFYLEGSCIKQIRNIFKMSQHEFSEKASDRVSTIALFPTHMDNSRASGIRTAFEIMQKKFNRPQNLLKEVTADSIVDFMYGYPSGVETGNTSTARVKQPATGPPPLQSIQNTRPALTVSSIHGQPSTMPAASQMLPTVAQQSMVPGMTIHQFTSQKQRQIRPAKRARTQRYFSINARTTVPNVPGTLMNPRRGINDTLSIITIPWWNNVKKKLVHGGVYYVKTQEGTHKYCLWNGTTLAPCVVDNNFKCDYICIGSIRCKSNDMVRIRNDGSNFEIKFKFQNLQSRLTEMVIITQQDLVDCLVCFDRLSALLIYPTANCVTKIRSKCGMNPFSKAERRRHLILFLKDVNSGQKESLLSTKHINLGDSQQRAMVREIDGLEALQIISTVKQNSHIDDFLESLVGELQNPDLNDGAVPEPTAVDDDVIMTHEELGVKCPYTQQVMKDPIKNKICGHNYEKVAILEFIARRKAKGNARCPYVGCGNQKPLTTDDLAENHELHQYIQKQIAEGSLPS